MGSSRFPGKPLKKIKNFTMIEHCYYRSKLTKNVMLSYIATCDKAIFDYCRERKINAMMTSKKHNRASDRVAEALKKIEKKHKLNFDIILMLQGDEPMVSPPMMEKLLSNFIKSRANVANLICKMSKKKEIMDQNEIKVVKDKFNNAIYYSRNVIPHNVKKGFKSTYYKQVCAIPFFKNALIKFNSLQETFLEKSESIDMMRLLENNKDVFLVKTDTNTYSVDNNQDLQKVKKLMKLDKFIKKYEINR